MAKDYEEDTIQDEGYLNPDEAAETIIYHPDPKKRGEKWDPEKPKTASAPKSESK